VHTYRRPAKLCGLKPLTVHIAAHVVAATYGIDAASVCDNEFGLCEIYSSHHKHMYRCCPYNKKLFTKYYLIQLIAHGSIATQLYRYDARWNQTKCW